ncbi:MAG: TonB family protein [Proteobacteria bacterium]|nr:TonB family protein [Pseudomonadota bacterium]MBU1709447.1 TonB family protein [Pseudomonadota bacterium]
MTRQLNAEVFDSCIAVLVGVSLTYSLFAMIPLLSSGAWHDRLKNSLLIVELVELKPPVPPVRKQVEKIQPVVKKIPIPQKKIVVKPQEKLAQPVEEKIVEPVETRKEVQVQEQETVETAGVFESTEPEPEGIPVQEPLPVPVPFFKLTATPRFLHRETPVFPESMKLLGRSASVKVEALIDDTGMVRKVTILKSAGEIFDQAAIEAFLKSTFIPGKVDGNNVAVLYRTHVNFRLK